MENGRATGFWCKEGHNIICNHAFPLLGLFGFDLIQEVLGIPNMVGEWPTSGLMLANSLAAPYVTAPLLDKIGLRGCYFMDFGKTKIQGESSAGVKSSMCTVTQSTLCLNGSKSLNKFIFFFFFCQIVGSPEIAFQVSLSPSKSWALFKCSCLSNITIATPLFTIRMILDLSYPSLLRAINSYLLMLGFGVKFLFKKWLVFHPEFHYLHWGGSLRHASSTLAMYSSLGEHLCITAKLGPLANRISCESVRGMEGRLTTQLALMLSLFTCFCAYCGSVCGCASCCNVPVVVGV